MTPKKIYGPSLPGALRLADACEESANEWRNEIDTRVDAAAELRRLHAENEALRRDARGIFDAGWKAAASFCERDDVIADGIVGECGCPQFERACADAIDAAKGEKNGA